MSRARVQIQFAILAFLLVGLFVAQSAKVDVQARVEITPTITPDISNWNYMPLVRAWGQSPPPATPTATPTLGPTDTPTLTLTPTPGGVEAPTIKDIDNADGDGNFVVEWSAVADVDGYRLREGVDGAEDAVIYAGAEPRLTRSNLPKGTYCYRVRATIEQGEWGPYSEISCTTVIRPVNTPTSTPTLGATTSPEEIFFPNGLSMRPSVEAGDLLMYGKMVDLDNGTAIVGTGPGRTAYVYIHSNSGWNLQQELVIPDDPDERWGAAAVALDGDTAIFVAGSATGYRAAYVYTRSGTIWTLQQRLVSSSQGNPHYNVALDGDTAIISVQRTDGTDAAGSVYVFTRSNDTWKLQQEIKQPLFRSAIALDGDTAIVGHYVEDIDGEERVGAVYIYTRVGTTWSLQQKLTGSANESQFGRAVALDGDTAVIVNGHEGAAIFTRDGTRWGLQQKLDGTFTAFDSSIYYSTIVAISKDVVLIGAPREDVYGYNEHGAAYVFERSGTIWNLNQKLVTTEGGDLDHYGMSVAMDATAAVIGIPNAEYLGYVDYGQVSFYRRK